MNNWDKESSKEFNLECNDEWYFLKGENNICKKYIKIKTKTDSNLK